MPDSSSGLRTSATPLERTQCWLGNGVVLKLKNLEFLAPRQI